MSVDPTVERTHAGHDAGVRRLVDRAVAPRHVAHRLDHHRPDVDHPRLRRSLVAVAAGGDVVGVATAVTSARHPLFNHVVVDVDPAWRSGPLGGQLLDGLAVAMADAGCTRRWATTVDADDADGAAFLAAHGFRPGVTSQVGRVPVDAVVRAGLAPVPGMVTVAEAAWSDEVVQLYEELYDEAHWWSPYVPWARGVPWASFLGRPVAGATFVARDLLDRPIAVTSVHESPAGELVIAPTLVRHGARRPDAAAVLAALLDRSVAGAAAAVPGTAWLAWEVDDSAPELGEALRRFPVEVTGETVVWATPDVPSPRRALAGPVAPEAGARADATGRPDG